MIEKELGQYSKEQEEKKNSEEAIKLKLIEMIEQSKQDILNEQRESNLKILQNEQNEQHGT